MAEDLPEPASRKEEYLAKAAGMDVDTLPEPASREEQYLNAIAEGGGGGTSNFNNLSNRPKYKDSAMTGETNIKEFTGTDGNTAGTEGLVPAPATTDADKFLKSDGTWDTAGGGGVTPVQTTGTSTTDVMSQDATSKMVFDDPGSNTQIKIGNGAFQPGTNGIVIGNGAYNSVSTSNNISIGSTAGCTASSSYDAIAIGDQASTQSHSSITIGRGATVGMNIQGSVALGAYSKATRKGEINIGTSWNATGYDNTAYRVIGGVHDPVDAHDAATKGYVDAHGGGDTVYSGKTTSSSATGGAVYIGNLDSSQVEQADPTTTDNHYRYYWSLPVDNTRIPQNNTINMLGDIASSKTDALALNGTVYGDYGIAVGPSSKAGQYSLALGCMANAGETGTSLTRMIAIGQNSFAKDASDSIAIGTNGSSYGVKNSASVASIAIGRRARVGNNSNGYKNSVALGAYSEVTRQGEVNVGLVNGETTGGYNDTAYRVIGGVHDGVDAHDCLTVGQANALIDAINSALNTNIAHIGS